MLRFSIILTLAVILAIAISNIPSEPVVPMVQKVLSVIVQKVIIIENAPTTKEVHVVVAPTTTVRAFEKKIVAIVNDTRVEYLRLLSLNIYTGKAWTVDKLNVIPLKGVGRHHIPHIEVIFTNDEVTILNGYRILPVPQYIVYNEVILNKSLIAIDKEPYYYDKSNHALLSKTNKNVICTVRNIFLLLSKVKERPTYSLRVIENIRFKLLKNASTKLIICTPYNSGVSIPSILWSVKIKDCILNGSRVNATENVRRLAYALLKDTGINESLWKLIYHLIRYLRENTKYSMNSTILSQYTNESDIVDAFLFKIKAGVCFHYASAAAILLRAIGIKANIVLGYAGGSIVNGRRYFTAQGHSWVEVFIPQLNIWVPFDPTPPDAISFSALNVSEVVEEALRIHEEQKSSLEPKPTEVTTPSSVNTPMWQNTTTYSIITSMMKQTTTMSIVKILFTTFSSLYRYLEENMQTLLLYGIPMMLIVLDVRNVVLWFKSSLRRRYRKVTREVVKTLKMLERKYGIKLHDKLTLRENIINVMGSIPSNKRRYLETVLEVYEKSRFGSYPESKACREIRYYRRLLGT